VSALVLPTDGAGAAAASAAVPAARVWRAMRPYARQVAGLLSIGSVCGIVMNTAVVLPAVLLGRAVDAVLAHERGQAGAGAVTGAVLLLIAGTAATELPRIGKRYWLGVCKNRIRANVRADAFGGVLSWPAERLHTTSVGEVMARIVGDVEVLGTGVGEVIVETWDTLLFSVSLTAAMLDIDPTLGVLALLPVPVALGLSKVVGVHVVRRTVRAREANATLTAFVQEGLAGLRVLRVAGRVAAYTARLRELADRQADAELAGTRLQALLAPVYTTLVSAGVVPILWLGGHRVAGGALTIGGLVAFLGLFGRFTARAFRIPQMANRVQAATAAYSRLAPLLSAPPPAADEPRGASWRSDRVAGLPPFPSSGPRPAEGSPASAPEVAPPAAVRLREITFTYPHGSTPALDRLTLDLPPGALVAVTGPVGAGKSALAHLVSGLYRPDSGQVRVDGTDPHDGEPADRARIGYLPQGHPVFSGTLADNVLLPVAGQLPPDAEPTGAGEPISSVDRGRLADALAVARLTEEVAVMPDGVHTAIGELGVQVSGGQRQRIALARSLAAPVGTPRLLVLDDPFSAVDVDTEARIVAGLLAAVGPQAPVEHRATVLLCSSRLAAFPHADLVVVLNAGQIAERGTHAALLAAGGWYGRVFRAQQPSRTALQPPPGPREAAAATGSAGRS